jgi:hypothetical protein
MYRHYNICNIPIYFYNVDIQHLQHNSETLETLLQHAVFTLLLPYDATQSGGTTDTGKPAAEDGGAAWQRPVVPAPGLDPASDSHLSWTPGCG